MFNKQLSWKLFFGIVTLGVLIDQASKWIFTKSLPEYVRVNLGVAFSFPVEKIFLLILSAVIIGLVLFLVARDIFKRDFVWAIFLGGAIGNFIDRLVRGGVVDFIHVGNFPVFNIADILLSVATVLIIYYYIIQGKNE